MAKNRTVFVCSNCGYESSKWNGKCPDCNEWNTLEEQAFSVKGTPAVNMLKPVATRRLKDITSEEEIRYYTGIGELDRVLGGGLVKGSIVLLGGEPGIGKSTILLQICQFLGEKYSVLYVSGEESARQLKLRAERLGVTTENLYMLASTDAESVNDTISVTKPDIVIIDSIQTMNLRTLNTSPGSITQVRECTNLFMYTAKSLEIPIFIVGHVNKDGNIAGPKVMEHIVDAVLYFEGERNLSYRILRAVKNRFGSTNEIGVFEMLDKGLREVSNPSEMLLSGRPLNVSGTCVTCVMEGSRPILAEVQALATKSGFSAPRRTATGFDFSRMAIIIAVLEKRTGIFFGTLDVYLNIVGGFKLDETAGDLSVALSLQSSVFDKPLPEKLVAFGEVGLGGEVRSVSHIVQRVKEAERMGFESCIIPKHNLAQLNGLKLSIKVIGVTSLKQAFYLLNNEKNLGE
ncbi:MAG: DNA repair protein RadA [Oscillospiraceae bacterium]|jgi:DNA repair protein RadA/Sms|nr:DNA repair protein RadA [Oscillospiraceae bacterium]